MAAMTAVATDADTEAFPPRIEHAAALDQGAPPFDSFKDIARKYLSAA